MSIKSILKKELYKYGILLERPVDTNSLEAIFSRIRHHYVSVDLVRIGGNNDGGYLIPNILDEIDFCFSPGVEQTANFERELSKKYNIKSFMIDGSVDKPPFKDINFDFDKVFLGSYNSKKTITLDKWFNDKLKRPKNNCLLQMDIENAEYDVLISSSSQTLLNFSCMIIEFHSIDRIVDRHFFRMFSGLFEKLYQSFCICHIHPNNCCGIASYKGFEIPRTIEVTFLRNDYVKKIKKSNRIILPHKLDRKNVASNEDINMPYKWWKKIN